jgi:hypothetical protein
MRNQMNILYTSIYLIYPFIVKGSACDAEPDEYTIYLYIPLYTSIYLYIPFHPTSVATGTHRPSWTLNVVHKAHQCLRFHASHSNTIKLLFGKIDPCWVRCEIWLLVSAQETGTWGFREEQLLVDQQQLCCWCQSACSNRSPSEAATYWA